MCHHAEITYWPRSQSLRHPLSANICYPLMLHLASAFKQASSEEYKGSGMEPLTPLLGIYLYKLLPNRQRSNLVAGEKSYLALHLYDHSSFVSNLGRHTSERQTQRGGILDVIGLTKHW